MAGRLKLKEELLEIGRDETEETGEPVPTGRIQRRAFFIDLGVTLIAREAALRREEEEKRQQAQEERERIEAIAHFRGTEDSALLALAKRVGSINRKPPVPAKSTPKEETKAPAKKR